MIGFSNDRSVLKRQTETATLCVASAGDDQLHPGAERHH
jgi:hypothetical protein